MNCKEVEERDVADRYLLEQLGEPDRDDFEAHYFECEACFSELQTSRSLQSQLRLQSPAGARVPSGSFRLPMWASAAAVLLMSIGLAILWRTRVPSPAAVASSSPGSRPPSAEPPKTPSQAELRAELLARVVPPPYVGSSLRGPEDRAHAEFRRAMRHYVKGDYENAIDGLRVAANTSPETPAYNFYLGACYLLTKQLEAAVDAFHKTISLGDTPYLESSHFFVAKAYLAEGRVSAAEDELRMTIRLRGSRQAEARDILGQLQK